MSKRNLRLGREVLGELSSADLSRVIGAYEVIATTRTFDTCQVKTVVESLLCSGPDTEGTCTAYRI